MIGAADLISQMADRFYLERCRDFLYREFVAAGADRKTDANGNEQLIYTSGEDLLARTPGFYDALVKKRLSDDFGDIDHYLTIHFGGRNPYRESMDKNLAYVRHMIGNGDFSGLRRHPVPLLPGYR